MLWQMSYLWGSQTLLYGSVPHDSQCAFRPSEIAMFSKVCITDSVESLCITDSVESFNSLKLSFLIIQGLCSHLIGCEYFVKSNSSDILPSCETNLGDSIDCYNFFVKGYVSLIRKDSVTWLILQFMRKGTLLVHESSLENSEDS